MILVVLVLSALIFCPSFAYADQSYNINISQYDYYGVKRLPNLDNICINIDSSGEFLTRYKKIINGYKYMYIRLKPKDDKLSNIYNYMLLNVFVSNTPIYLEDEYIKCDGPTVSLRNRHPDYKIRQ